MFKILRRAFQPRPCSVCKPSKYISRTFLSPAYYCDEIWDNRLNSPILQKVNLDLLYHELDQRFQRTRRISPVDVDIYANAAKDDLFLDELLDLMYKLRLSQDTGRTLNSTGHAVIRALVNNNRVSDLLNIIDDRLNYGVFLDDYTANYLMDKFWKSKDFVAGLIVASQMMLQEDFNHPLTIHLSLLHCYNYLLKPSDWPQTPPPEEPEEEVKVRVKYVRNAYDDEHFDLKDPQRIVGKTLMFAAKNSDDSLHRSLRLIGIALFGKEELFKEELAKCTSKNVKLVKEVVDLLPSDSPFKQDLLQIPSISEDVQSKLQKQVADSAALTSEKDIANQCELFLHWESERIQALEEQKKRLQIAQRLTEIEKLQKSLDEKEQKLWFFEKEETIELEIEERTAAQPVKEEVVKKQAEDTYIPPEVSTRRTN